MDLKAIIQVSNLNISYNKKQVVHNVSFNVASGKFHALIGINGAGKTTIIKAILGAIENFEGKITLNGLSNLNINSKQLMGYVPEKMLFPNNISIFKYLAYMGYIGGFTMDQAKNRVKELLIQYDLSKYSTKKLNQLSSGETKKIMLIQALINKPKILIMDEPTANFDSIATREFYENVNELKKQGITIFLSTHYLEEIEKYLDSLTVVDQGKVIFSGALKSFAKKQSLLDSFIDVIKGVQHD